MVNEHRWERNQGKSEQILVLVGIVLGMDATQAQSFFEAFLKMTGATYEH